ncbi:MAG: polymerase subunit delta [Chthoniobacter sp.]|jgi:DNA polymerase-3 subunit delta'|nr:polymerase subunit delta [Chthoniobacter sp.]
MGFTKNAALELLQRAHSRERLAHAYLFTGAAGSGKRSLAADLAAVVVGTENPLHHPDVHIAEPESKSRRIVIEQMRGLERELQMRATGDGKKVGIVFDADRLQIQASNAFLKTLEEPPHNSLLLLTSEQPEALPPTILSRCIAVSLTSKQAPQLSPLQVQFVEALRGFFQSENRDVTATYRLVREFTLLLQKAREEIAAENAGELKKEELHYKQTTESDWLDDREDFYKALTESRYVHQRGLLIETAVQWWADVLRQQQNFAAIDLPQCATETARVATELSTAEALRRLAHLEGLRENLGRNVKEDLTIEVAFLDAFAGPA